MTPDFAKPIAAPSVFSRISSLAREYGAVNLGQGFPDFPPDEQLRELLAYHAHNSGHQYAPLPGIPALLERIVAKTARCHDVKVDAATELTITSGATQGLWTSIQSVVGAGDEVVIFEPAYDSYAPAVLSVGGVVKPIVLRGPEFGIDWSAVAKTLTARTRLVILNNPHNPTGTTWSAADFDELSRLLAETSITVLSDEVYEHLTYDGREHLSVLRYPRLRERALVVSSFGKTFHITGWKVGYVVAPPALMARYRSLHQFTVFTVSTPAQRAIADYLAEPAHYERLPEYFAAKRDRLTAGLAESRLRVLPSAGSYFCLADYSAISDEGEERFAARLITDHGVATIPLAPFYSTAPPEERYVRLCFAKQTATLDDATQRLQSV